MSIDTVGEYCPKNSVEWRKWLTKNHQSEQAIWLILYKKSSSKHNLSWSEAVDQALCFGWIDSVKRSINDEKFKQYFSIRKKGSIWSKVNKEKIEDLRNKGLIKEQGEAVIQRALIDGSWNFLDPVDNLEIPKDLAEAFEEHPQAKEQYEELSVGKKKLILYKLITAKRSATRKKRIEELIQKGELGELPSYFQ